MPNSGHTLEHYLDAIARLRRDQNRPHKPAMLLAVISLIEGKTITENRIEYDAPLLGMFRKIFDVVGSAGDRCTPYFPFFHLRSEGFWHHEPVPGREPEYKAAKTVQSGGALRQIVSAAYLDDQLFMFLTESGLRETIRQAIISTYFADKRTELLTLLGKERAVADYGLLLLKHPGEQVAADSGTTEEVRDAAFGKVVKERYDHQCAACGLRLVLDDGTTIVDAAHIVPFSVSHDNDIRNGMALCKNHHWAMDRFLIAPDPDLKWMVNRKALDDRRDGQRELVALGGRKILVPASERYWPKKESLEWRSRELKQRAG